MVAIIDELAQNGATAYFGAGACPGSPQSFIMDEKRDKCEGLEPTSKVHIA